MRLISLFLFCLLLANIYSTYDVQCSEGGPASSFEGTQGDANADADIAHITFTPSLKDVDDEIVFSNDSINIWMYISGNFQRALTQNKIRYYVFFYDSEFRKHEEFLGYVVLLTMMDNKTIDLIFANPEPKKNLSFTFPEPYMVNINNVNLTELGFQPENGKYVFYVSAVSYVLEDELYGVDIEPDTPSGDPNGSMNYHARIVIEPTHLNEITPSPTQTENPPITTETEKETQDLPASTEQPSTTYQEPSKPTEPTTTVEIPKSQDPSPHYLITLGIIVAGVIIAFAIYRTNQKSKKNRGRKKYG